MEEPPDKVRPIRPEVKHPEQSARDMRSHLMQPGFKEFLDAMAEYDRLRYKAYLAAGFTDEQAMYLIKKEQQ